MENKNTRGIKKIIVGITIMFFSLFFSLLVDSNRIEAAGVHQLSECSDGTLVEGYCPGSFVSIKIPYYSYKVEHTEKIVNSMFFTSLRTFTVDGNIEVYIKKRAFLGAPRHVALFKEGKEVYSLIDDNVRIYSNYEERNETINFNDSDLGNGVYYLIYVNEYANNEVMYKLSVDLTPPTVSFSSNSNSTYKQSHSVTVTVNDNIGVDHNYLRYAWTTTTTFPQNTTSSTLVYNSSKKGTKTITTPSGATGKYYLHIEVKDTAGNKTRSRTSGPFFLDNNPPTLNYITLLNHSTGRNYEEGTWINSSVLVDYYCVDARAGIKSCEVYNGSTKIEGYELAPSKYLIDQEINSSNIRLRMEDNAGNVTFSESKTIRIDKTIKSVQFDNSVTDGLTFGINGLGSNRAPLDLVTISINGNPVKLWSTAYPGANSMEIMKFDYYGVYNIEITTKDKAGNIGTYKHQVTHENPNSMVDEIYVSYGPDGNRSHLSPIISEDMSVVIIRNDGINNSKIMRTSANLLYSGFFGNNALSGANIQKIGYSINDGANKSFSPSRDDIRIPPIDVDSPSCVNDEDYLTCAKIDILTLFIEYTIDGDANTPHMTSTLKSQQTITLISLDVRPVDVSAGSGTQSMNLNVGQVYEVEPLSFDSQIGNEIVSIDETIEFNGEVVDSIDTNKIGTYTITTIATDSEGFKSLPVVRTIVIKDSIPPTISLIGEQTITIKKGQTYVDEGSLAIDNVDGEITVYGSGEVNYNKAGTYEITYQYIDSNGNVSEVVTRTIIVKPDYAKYVILALSSITVLGIAFMLIKKFNVKTSY